jgi:hypothetical protein
VTTADRPPHAEWLGDAPLDEALAALRRIADAAGIFPQTCEAASIAEVGDMIALWCAQRRSAPDRAVRGTGAGRERRGVRDGNDDEGAT